MNQSYKAAMAGCLLLMISSLHAQIILHVGAAEKMFISNKTDVSFDSLVVTPSHGGMLLHDNDITKSPAPVNPFTGTYLKRVYCFSHPVHDYDGSLSIFYDENETATVDVSKLLLQGYSDGSWNQLSYDKNKNTSGDAMVGVVNVHHRSFSELLAGYMIKNLPPDPDSKEAPITLVPTVDARLSVSLFPNPASDIINLRVNGNAIIKRVEVFDASGKLLMSKEGSNSNVYSFVISSLASGFYMMAIETNSGKLSKEFVKQ